MDGEPAADATLFPTTVGEKLRAAREAQGLALADIAARTRIPQRHLEAIEKGNYSGLPSPTYAMGFAKAYARAVNADEVAIARDLRKELDATYDRAPATVPYEMEDPTRTPSGGLVWAGVLVAVLVLLGVVLFYTTSLFRGGEAPPPQETLALPTGGVATDPDAVLPTPTPTPIPAAGGQVGLTAIDTVWLRVTDAQGERLFEKEMQPGERYDIPMTAEAPRVRTGRADQMRVTVKGSDSGLLGPAQETVDLEVTTQAIRARQAGEGAQAAP